MILGASAQFSAVFVSKSAEPTIMFLYGDRSLPPLAIPLPLPDDLKLEAPDPSILSIGLEISFATGVLKPASAVVDRDQFTLSTEPVAQEFGADATVQGTVYFDVDRSTLRPCGWVGLRELVAEYRSIFESPNARISVLGFTDSTGTDAHNDLLSQQRADTVKAALQLIGGPDMKVPAANIRSIGLGRNPSLGQLSTRNDQLQQYEKDFIASKQQELGILSPGQDAQRWRSVSIILNDLIRVDLKSSR
jgi:outer membrane protein OmpA-like peptidoglycan-associated protein